MNLTYKENEDGVLIPQLAYPDNEPLGRFGTIALDRLEEKSKGRYTAMLMKGTLMTYGHQIEEKMNQRISELETLFEEQQPLTREQQMDTMTAWKIREQFRQQAIEVAMKEIIG
ncbi:TPA: TnpV protein [Enterococcus faecalis]|uniref:TnpV protein n=1 Tax=Enterococcus faecalis TaxID=1351 RepID=UPI0035A90158